MRFTQAALSGMMVSMACIHAGDGRYGLMVTDLLFGAGMAVIYFKTSQGGSQE